MPPGIGYGPAATTTSGRRRQPRPVEVQSPDGRGSAVVRAPSTSRIPAGRRLSSPVMMTAQRAIERAPAHVRPTAPQPAVSYQPRPQEEMGRAGFDDRRTTRRDERNRLTMPLDNRMMPEDIGLADFPATKPPAPVPTPVPTAQLDRPTPMPRVKPGQINKLLEASREAIAVHQAARGRAATLGAEAGPPAAATATPAVEAPGATLRTVTGNEVPFQVMPGRSEEFQALLAPLQAEALRRLKNPSVYDDELFAGAVDQSRRLLDEEFGRAEDRLDANLAGRGLDYSSVAAGKLSDLATEKGRAFTDLLRPLMRERAMSIGGARAAAFDNARGLAGFRSNQEAGERAEIRGERGYVDHLRGTARSEALEEMLIGQQLERDSESDFQSILARALGYGQSGAGMSALTSASMGFGQGAEAQAAEQARQDEALAVLAQLFMQQEGA